jgi:hypothetical protein
MHVFEVDQGSPAWHACRAGCCTASKVKDARKLVMASGPNKGGPSPVCSNYAFGLAIERISGEPLQDDRFETFAMRRGHELEPEARACHEALGVMVVRAGFVTTNDGRIGASVDGLIDPRGAAEYKALVAAEGLREILMYDDLSDFQDQMQTGLLVTEREFMHFGLYCPALKPIGLEFSLRVVWRDEAYMAPMKRDLQTFIQMVDDAEGMLRIQAAKNPDYIARALATLE